MGLIANLLKRKSVPQEQIDSSLQMLDMLKEKRGAEIGKYLDLMVDDRKIPVPSAVSTIEDLDAREPVDASVYSPPAAATYCAPVHEHGAAGSAADPTETGDPIETGLNRFFDAFAGQASAYNQNVKDPGLSIGIRRPRHSAETFPEENGAPVLDACLHTAHWGIFFFGYSATVDVYLLPYDESHSLTFKEVHEDGCRPMISVTTRMGGADREWYADGKLLVRDRMPALAKEFLDDLVNAASQ